jgi:hypothetical protein
MECQRETGCKLHKYGGGRTPDVLSIAVGDSFRPVTLAGLVDRRGCATYSATSYDYFSVNSGAAAYKDGVEVAMVDAISAGFGASVVVCFY